MSFAHDPRLIALPSEPLLHLHGIFQFPESAHLYPEQAVPVREKHRKSIRLQPVQHPFRVVPVSEHTGLHPVVHLRLHRRVSVLDAFGDGSGNGVKLLVKQPIVLTVVDESGLHQKRRDVRTVEHHQIGTLNDADVAKAQLLQPLIDVGRRRAFCPLLSKTRVSTPLY